MKQMNARVFFDSNVLIYAYSTDDSSKQNHIQTIAETHYTVISTQTINEFINVMKKKKGLSYAQIMGALTQIYQNFAVEVVNQTTIEKAVAIAMRYSYSYFDSLMIAAALMSSCSVLYSEDMHHQHVIENMTIINPFTSLNNEK